MTKLPDPSMETYGKIHRSLAHRNIHVPSIATPRPQYDKQQSTSQDHRVGRQLDVLLNNMEKGYTTSLSQACSQDSRFTYRSMSDHQEQEKS